MNPMGLIYTAPFFCVKVAAATLMAAYAYFEPPLLRAFWRKSKIVSGLKMRSWHAREKRGPGFTHLSAEFPSRASFEFNRETWLDRWFKKRVLAEEIQTGAADFDDAVYIQSDSAEFGRALRSNTRLRTSIRALFDSDQGSAGAPSMIGGPSILLESQELRLLMRGDRSEDPITLATFAELFNSLRDISSRIDFSDDRFMEKFRRVRTLLACSFVYAFMGIFELSWTQSAVFVSTLEFAKISAVLALVILATLVVYTMSNLHGSSRLPRVLTRYGVLLVVAIFPLGLGIVADVDRYFDTRSEVIVERVVHDLQRIERHSGKGPRYRFYGCFDRAELSGWTGLGAEMNLPDCMDLSSGDFYRLQRGQGVRFHIGQGALGLPWYKQIQSLEM